MQGKKPAKQTHHTMTTPPTFILLILALTSFSRVDAALTVPFTVNEVTYRPSNYTIVAQSCNPYEATLRIAVGGRLYEEKRSASFSHHHALNLLLNAVNSHRCGIVINGLRHAVEMHVFDDWILTAGKDEQVNTVKKLYRDIANQEDENGDPYFHFLLGSHTEDYDLEAARIMESTERIVMGHDTGERAEMENDPFYFSTRPDYLKSANEALSLFQQRGLSKIALIGTFDEDALLGAQTSAISLAIDIAYFNSTIRELEPEGDSSAEVEEAKMLEMIEAIRALQPDGVFFLSTWRPTAVWLKTLRKANYQPPFSFVHQSLSTPSLIEEVGLDNLKYHVGSTVVDFAMNATDALMDTSLRAFRTRYENLYGELTQRNVLAVAGFSALLQAIESTGSVNGTIVKQALVTESYNTLMGPVSFEHWGGVKRTHVLVAFDEEGVLRTIAPQDIATGELVYPVPQWAQRDCLLGEACSGLGTCLPSGGCACTGDLTNVGSACINREPEDFQYSPTVKAVAAVLFGINALASAACFTWTVVNRKQRIVKASQVEFLAWIAFGTLLSTSVILLLSIDDSSSSAAQELARDGLYEWANMGCMGQYWVYAIGFVFTFGPLLAKIWRVQRIVDYAKKLQKLTITRRRTIAIIAVATAFDVLILGVWQLTNPLVYKRVTEYDPVYGLPVSSRGVCSPLNEEEPVAGFYIALVGYHVLLLLYGLLVCYRARNIPTALSESKFVTAGIVSHLQILLLATPVLIIVSNSPEGDLFVRSSVIFLNDMGLLLLIFGPKMYWVQFRPDLAIMPEFFSRASATHSKSTVTPAAQSSAVAVN